MKTFALAISLGASLVSTAALAGEQRPTYLAFKAPAVSNVAGAPLAPVGPTVRKRNSALSSIPLFIPLVGGVALLGFVAAVTTGGGGSNGSPN